VLFIYFYLFLQGAGLGNHLFFMEGKESKQLGGNLARANTTVTANVKAFRAACLQSLRGDASTGQPPPLSYVFFGLVRLGSGSGDPGKRAGGMGGAGDEN
jgi:hypothetical protein